MTLLPVLERDALRDARRPREHGPTCTGRPPRASSASGRPFAAPCGRSASDLGDVAYNVVFHSAPYRATGEYHWHVHILPCLTTRAGFELGTGVMINVVGPEKAAEDLREAWPYGVGTPPAEIVASRS